MPFSFNHVRAVFHSKILKNSLKVLGVCSACFVFEACYGTPQADYPPVKLDDVDVSGTWESPGSKTMAGEKVLLTGIGLQDTLQTYTDEKGNFVFYDVPYDKGNYHLFMATNGKTEEKASFIITRDELLNNRKNITIQ